MFSKKLCDNEVSQSHWKNSKVFLTAGVWWTLSLPNRCWWLHCCKFYWLNQSFIKRQTSDTSSDNKWYNEWQWITVSDKNDNEWHNKCQQVTASDKEWQQVTTNDNKWQQVTARGKTNENGTIHIEEWMIAIFYVTTLVYRSHYQSHLNFQQNAWNPWCK